MPSQSTLAIVWILKALIELAMVVLFAGFFGLMGMVPLLAGEQDGMVIGSVFIGMSVLVISLFAVLTIPTVIIGVGFWRGAYWGKIGILILAMFNLMHLPIGTLLAILTFLSLKEEFSELNPTKKP